MLGPRLDLIITVSNSVGYALFTLLFCFTHKHLEMHECILSTVATDVLVLKHQAIRIHSTDK